MLSRLQINNFVLINSLDISFPEGLIIITGQTGAGKSILLGALSLLTGAKADASSISADADNCVVEAEFTGIGADVRDALERQDVEWDDERLLIRRVVSRSGRSRSFINDCPVPLALLLEISGKLVDIHSQHKSLLLTDPAFQLSVLDRFAGNASLLSECSHAWRKLNAIRSEADDLSSRLARLKADESYNRSLWEKLDSAHLRDGELAELEEEQKQLANAEHIKDCFLAVRSCTASDDADCRPGLLENLKEARKQLERLFEFIPATKELGARLESSRLEIADILDELDSLDSGIVSSPERLEIVEDRMSLIYSLLKKHSCTGEKELIEVRDGLAETLFDTSSLEEKILQLKSELAKAEEEYRSICTSLHNARLSAAPGFSSEITGSLRFLELDRAVFSVEISDAGDTSYGSDKVRFLFNAVGGELMDLSKCASGGEISRIMLCLKAMVAKFAGMPTMVFDEIDTGVSGSVADRMGQMICSMGRNMQVFSITHLPQVAAKGDAHYVVTKTVCPDGRTVSGISEVSGEGRVMEIARLLSGSSISEAAIANAESLLKGC